MLFIHDKKPILATDYFICWLYIIYPLYYDVVVIERKLRYDVKQDSSKNILKMN